MKKTERNKKIVGLVLKGWSYKQVGFLYNITGTRVRQITAGLLNKNLSNINIRNLRKNKNQLITRINAEV